MAVVLSQHCTLEAPWMYALFALIADYFLTTMWINRRYISVVDVIVAITNSRNISCSLRHFSPNNSGVLLMSTAVF